MSGPADGAIDDGHTGLHVEELHDLVKQYPGLGTKLFDQGRIRQYVNVFVDDEDIRYLEEMETKLKDGAVVALIPAVAGG